MDQPGSETSIAEIEMLVLRAVCQETPQGPAREAAARTLSQYAWREPVHLAIYKCLLSTHRVKPEDLRSELLACLTRKGFPDIELEFLFEPHTLSCQIVEQLMLRLKTSEPA
jgi:hypothetical protein